MILFLIAASNIMSYAMSFTGIPAALSAMLMSITDNKYILLLIMNVFLLVLGMFLDLTPAVLIFTPIFLPIATGFGMNSVLFVGCNVANVTMEEVTKYIVPTFFAMVLALMLVTYIPALTLFIPQLAGLI